MVWNDKLLMLADGLHTKANGTAVDVSKSSRCLMFTQGYIAFQMSDCKCISTNHRG